VKRTLSFRSGREAPISISEAPSYDGDTLLAEADGWAVHKPCSDITVSGSAFSASPVPHLVVAVAVGAARKRIRVHGERRLRLRGGRMQFERVAPFCGERLLSYADAYGGVLGARSRSRRGAFGAGNNDELDPNFHIYPRNPVGRGFITRELADAADGSLAPSQELEDDLVDPSRLLRMSPDDWTAAPLPGHFGPIAPSWFPRVQWLVPFSRAALGPHLAEMSLCGLTEADCARGVNTVDARVLSSAAPGLAVPSLAGRVPVELVGFRWGNGVARFGVDVTPPRTRLAFPGAGFYEVEQRLKTFAIDADAEEVSLVWAGFQPTAMRYRDEDTADIQVEVRS